VCDIDPWVQELKDFQRDGHSLEDLWKVAKGDIKYQDFVGSSLLRKGKQESHQAPAAPSIPEDLVRCQLLVGQTADKNILHVSRKLQCEAQQLHLPCQHTILQYEITSSFVPICCCPKQVASMYTPACVRPLCKS